MKTTRRDVCIGLPALLMMLRARAQAPTTLPSHIYNFDKLIAKTSGNLTARNVLDGKIFEGCHISLHESELAGHSIPHPPHKHRHEEMVFVTGGTLEFTIDDTPTRAGVGSVLFAGSNEMHGIRNPDSVPATYFVLALGAEDA